MTKHNTMVPHSVTTTEALANSERPIDLRALVANIEVVSVNLYEQTFDQERFTQAVVCQATDPIDSVACESYGNSVDQLEDIVVYNAIRRVALLNEMGLF